MRLLPAAALALALAAMAAGLRAQPAETPPAAEAPPRTSPPPTHPPYPVAPIERTYEPRVVLAPAPADKLEPMPPDSDPAGQAAWRARSYDRQIASDRRMAGLADGALTRTKAEVAKLPAAPADDPRRLRTLQTLDQWSGTKALSELHAQAAQVAKDAYAHAEAVRLQVAAGRRPAADLTAARAKAAQAERMVAAALQAGVDHMMVQAQASAKFAEVITKAAPELGAPPFRAELAKIIEVQERARLETLAYREVRDGVEAGKRPASDLEAAGQSLKAAQQTMYDLVDEMQKQSAAMQERGHQGNLERIKRYEADVATREASLPTLQGEARTDAEERLGRLKEILADTKKRDAQFAARRITSLPHPELPILPPRS
jgi:hypothetical protein